MIKPIENVEESKNRITSRLLQIETLQSFLNMFANQNNAKIY